MSAVSPSDLVEWSISDRSGLGKDRVGTGKAKWSLAKGEVGPHLLLFTLLLLSFLPSPLA